MKVRQHDAERDAESGDARKVTTPFLAQTTRWASVEALDPVQPGHLRAARLVGERAIKIHADQDGTLRLATPAARICR